MPQQTSPVPQVQEMTYQACMLEWVAVTLMRHDFASTSSLETPAFVHENDLPQQTSPVPPVHDMTYQACILEWVAVIVMRYDFPMALQHDHKRTAAATVRDSSLLLHGCAPAAPHTLCHA